ncbi:hypothetical protein [Streptomyces sp. NBC_00893]|uniref:hypothetical protein n=1 Tax=Streptomyces sp. NBC_00893 TaxID=2975862 RepID=UPI00224DA856|nr:hypothetical protein [Streptomyces sp. NBC_00893]MCX4851372.1 hypothetical protein [Streptomyces sp. NBC_00893]
MGYPEGHAGLPNWQAFRAARMKGPGYRWTLVDSKMPDVWLPPGRGRTPSPPTAANSVLTGTP